MKQKIHAQAINYSTRMTSKLTLLNCPYISTNIKRASVSDPEDLERPDSRFNV
jgi:hypothetical protein